MAAIISVDKLTKRYASGQVALNAVDLEIDRGEIFALLGPNGAGKTTLISIICGTVTATSGSVTIDGHDNVRAWRQARARVGLVPQEMPVDAFTSVIATLRFSRGLFGLSPDNAYLEQVLRDLSLWDKRHNKIMELSGGMKRRVLIAKALAHQPDILFLDEPTAGVDVSLRRDMWALVRQLRSRGTTVILTTHYIEEAEEMADRVGVISKGRIILTQDKDRLMQQLGKRRLVLMLSDALSVIPPGLEDYSVSLDQAGRQLVYTFGAHEEGTIPNFLRTVDALGIRYHDLDTGRSSLEDIFVDLVGEAA